MVVRLRIFLSRLRDQAFCSTCLAAHGYFTNHALNITNRLRMGQIAVEAVTRFPDALHREFRNCSYCGTRRRCIWFSWQ